MPRHYNSEDEHRHEAIVSVNSKKNKRDPHGRPFPARRAMLHMILEGQYQLAIVCNASHREDAA